MGEKHPNKEYLCKVPGVQETKGVRGNEMT